MATIINNQDFTLNPSEQEVISNAAVNMDLEEVIIGEMFDDEDGYHGMIPVYYMSDEDQEFAFNYNTKTGLIEA